MLLDNPRFLIFGNAYQAEKAQYVVQVLDTLRDAGASIAMEQVFYDFLQHSLGIALHAVSPFTDVRPDIGDVAISLGGDGTFLKTAALVGIHGIPIIGINTGRLGFLASVRPNEIADSIAAILHGAYTIDERTLIEVTAHGAALQIPRYALNEVALLKHENSSTINIRTCVDGKCLVHYIADGLILSTPSGSTGYALSVGGPILAPDIQAFVLAPVAPHSLSVRPVILSSNAVVQLSIESRNHNFLVAIDGQNQSLPETTTLTLRRAPFVLRIIKATDRSFYDTLREKLMWGADKRQ